MAQARIRKRRASHTGVRSLSGERTEEENGLENKHDEDSSEHDVCMKGEELVLLLGGKTTGWE